MKMDKPEGDPITQAEWNFWYQDNFDLECPRQLDKTGRGLIEGLIELWASHLYETIQPTGYLGFDRYNLWWKQRKCSIEVVGDIVGQVKLRQWVYGDRRSGYAGCMEIADKDFLRMLAEAHSRLVMIDQTSEPIIEKALQSDIKEVFRDQIKNIGMLG